MHIRLNLVKCKNHIQMCWLNCGDDDDDDFATEERTAALNAISFPAYTCNPYPFVK